MALSKAIKFELPAALEVEVGNAGNGTAVLSFRNGSGPTYECTYRGGSDEAHPTTDLQRAKGRTYRFKSGRIRW